LAAHLDDAARDLEAHADNVAALLARAGISSSTAPGELRDVAAWAKYRSRDLADTDLFAKAQELGLKVWGGGTRTPPLDSPDLERLGLSELQAELSKIAGHDVSIMMIYRSMGDVLARAPATVVPAP